MNTTHTIPSLDLWRRAIAVFAMIASGLVLIGGWVLDIEILRGVPPDFPNMKANTALALFAGGLAVWLLAEGASTFRRRLGLSAALLIVLIGGLTLAQYLFGWNLGIDQLLVADTTHGSVAPGRPAPNTALACVLLGLSLLCIERHTRLGDPAEWLAFGAGLIALLTLIGYAYGGQPLHPVLAHDGMALHTALVLMLLAFGVLLIRPHAGLIAVVASDSAGGYMARRLLPLALLAPPLLGWLRLLCERAGYYDPLFAVALFATANVAVIAVIVRRSILTYNALDLECRMTLEQSRKLSNAIEQTADSVIITNREGVIEYVNPAFEAITGYAAAEAIGKKPSLTKSGIHSETFYRNLWNTILGGKEFRAAFINRRKDGVNYHEQKTITPVKNRCGQITHFVSTGKDISEEVRQQRQLSESEQRFRATFEQAAVGVAHVSPGGHWLRVNQRLCTMVGYTHEELLQMTFQDITHPDDLDADLAQMRKILAGEITTYSMEKRYFRKNSSIIWICLTVSLVRDASDAPAYFIAVIEDIAERKRAEEETRLLQSITLAVSEAPDVDAALEIVLHKVSAATGWTFGEAWLPCDDDEHLQCAKVFYAHETGLEDFIAGSRNFRFARGEGLPGRVWLSRRPWWIPDVTQDTNFPRATLARNADLRSGLGVPVLADEEVVAILVFFIREARVEDERLVGIVAAVAAQLGQVIRRKRAEQLLHDSEERLRAILDAEPECVNVMSVEGTLMQINASGLTMIEAEDAEQVLGGSIQNLVIPEHRASFREHTMRVAQGAADSLQFEIIGLKGTHRWIESHAVPFNGVANNDVPLILAVSRDITAQKHAEERLAFLAHFDPLTNLPNRTLFVDRLRQAMIDAERRDRLVAVVLLDIDQFKNVNDSLGHEVGDALLRATGERLNAALRERDSVARLSGDDFAILLTDISHVDDVAAVIEKIMSAFATPFSIEGRELYMHASLGITLYPFDDINPQDLIRNANIAMYRAKQHGRNTWQFYAADMTAKAAESMALAGALHGAHLRDELRLHYQPLVSFESGRIVGVEALLRWQHPELGLVSPAKFIPIAEETGLIVPIGEWVLNTACAQLSVWRSIGFEGLRLAINLSPRQFREANLAESIKQILASAGLPAAALELELTEGLLLQKDDVVGSLLAQLDKLGVRLSIDDFGTGYSSLAYLKRLPIDTLKIDQSFVRDLVTDPDDATIVTTIIAMAHALGKHVVAEGVETAEQLKFLQSKDCDEMQGYYFSRPLPPEQIESLLRDDPHR